MFAYCRGTDLSILADHLLEELRKNPPENPLAPEIFVVQNHGMAQWFSLYMARKEGIAANLKFEFPSERIWSLIRQIDPEIPKVLPSDRGPLTWSLMELLQDETILSHFKNLQYYIRDSDPEQRAVRCWKLSSKIADVFDKYLVYRPDLILKWEENGTKGVTGKTELWQAKLWNELVNYWREAYDGKWLHRAELQRELIRHIDEKSLDIEKLPNRVSFFGVPTMPPIFVEIMVKLSKLLDVRFYQLSANLDKGENVFRNALLQSLGKEEIKFNALFSGFNISPALIEDEGDSGKLTMLGQIRKDIKLDKKSRAGSLDIPVTDSTVSVHSCHSPMREVEVLYDQLLRILDDNPGLNPDDILIMTPNIEAYAPMVKAVFEAPEEGQAKIPYSIADRGIHGQNPAIESFLKILSLCESRFKVTDVFDLLDMKPIRERFGLTDEDLNRLEQWVHENRIRWGIDGSFKKKIGLPESESFSWESGMNNILLGYTMSPEDDKLFNGISPYEEISNSDDAILAGKLSFFLQALFELVADVEKPKTPDHWNKILRKIPDTFLPGSKDYLWEVSGIRKSLDQFLDYCSLGGYSNKIPFVVVRSWLSESLSQQATGGGSIGRGVTFSSLRPMRGIPYKMIGMIGMDEGAFPKSKIPIEFDLMNHESRAGDPISSEDDRHLFLENILSAKTHLYFSYVGQSNRQDTEFPPSVVLNEFLDYLEDHYGIDSKSLVTKHSLQAFSPDYFMGQKLFSFSRTQQKISQQLFNEQPGRSNFLIKDLDEPDEDRKQLSLNDLIYFFQHPAKYLLQNRLGVDLSEDSILNEDREPFALSGLDNYQVGQELLERFMKDKSLAEYFQNLKAKDMLPEGRPGERAFHQKAEEVSVFGSFLKGELDRKELDDQEVHIEVDDFSITGKLSNIYENAIVAYRFGSMRPKDLIMLWIQHLAFQTVRPKDHPGQSRLFTLHRNKPFVEYRLAKTDDAKSILGQLLQLYWQGLQHNIYFFPESSFAYGHEVIFKGKSIEDGFFKASGRWERNYGGYPGEGDDPYNKMILGTENPFKKEQFQSISEQFWAPFFKLLIQEEQ